MSAPVIELAANPWRRMRGLLGRKGLPAGHALLIRPCNAIHTLGMRFAIDVRFYDRQGHRVKEVLNVRPGHWWVWGGWRAHQVLESAAGDGTFAPFDTLETPLTCEPNPLTQRVES